MLDEQYSITKLLSLETLEKVKIYQRLIEQWNRSISLIQVETIKAFYHRHVLDSIQIIPIIRHLSDSLPMDQIHGSHQDDLKVYENPLNAFLKPHRTVEHMVNPISQLSIIDVGTGAGFPGILLAMCGFQNVSLCEINHKKCLFLEELARLTEIQINILHQPIQSVEFKYEFIVSRAFSDLSDLLEITCRLAINERSYGLFHKGRSWESEILRSNESWLFQSRAYKSITSSDGVLLGISNVRKRP